MTDPKKRLKEILNRVYGQYPDNAGLTPTKEQHDDAIVEILKEFVHKDNLPSEDKIEKEINPYNSEIIHYSKHDARKLTKAIRKLIEGKK